MIASAGLTLASLLLLAMGAIAYWNTHFQHQAREAARGNQVQAIGRTVADSVTALLEADQLTAVRRLVAETARGNDLTMCRLALGDGRVIAHSNPSQIALEVLPERWSDEKVEAVTVTTTGSISLAYPITIAGRGTARLEMTAPIPRVASRYWETNAGVALFGAAAMLGLLLVYRRVRARVGALGVIRDALMDLDRGERSPLAPGHGPRRRERPGRRLRRAAARAHPRGSQRQGRVPERLGRRLPPRRPGGRHRRRPGGHHR
ncbi:MAG: hypothetical protein ACYTJ0_07610 [Planctomycetota bacterium]